MQSRHIALLALITIHGVSVMAAPHLPDKPAAVIAGSIYLPLMPLKAIGLPVLSSSAGWGWASVSILGWVLLSVFWVAVWWAVTAGLARLLRGRPFGPVR